MDLGALGSWDRKQEGQVGWDQLVRPDSDC